MDELAKILEAAARGEFPPADGGLTVLPQPSPRDAGVLALTGHAVVFADVPSGWIRRQVPPDDLGAPLGPPFLTALCARTGREAGSIDVLLALPPGRGAAGHGATAQELVETTDQSHPRVVRALAHRSEVRVWTSADGGTVLTGRGVAGRWEVAVEVDAAARGTGLGRELAAAARTLAPADETLWAQVAPGNAASLRTFLAAGFTPVGAEVLLSLPDVPR
ncbi:GNAT family N-acetyltransferase [Streptomyces spirodelae]|uniref:GNAT family N-acetyltransferase n=1 Tax=Streptomyces spirodelae TaxID=2812904 RepID=A0ABS3WZQ1_9ACTN|nr:GNAT family N-acetyltransferase [Streptomyces spirodelae]MBO8188610.1 GNAT family N-acetyltransferase [Streptomyces spirodelae]